jgi:hypothetical protein
VFLDRALFGVGAFGERQIVRFRTAPQNTRIVLVIVAGTLATLLLGSVLFFAMR